MSAIYILKLLEEYPILTIYNVYISISYVIFVFLEEGNHSIVENGDSSFVPLTVAWVALAGWFVFMDKRRNSPIFNSSVDSLM